MIIDKLTLPRTHLNCDDLTPNQKVLLWEVMERHGAKRGFSYDRFFDKGFFEWELLGVDAIKRLFLNDHAAVLFPYAPEQRDALIDDIIRRDGEFYRTLGLRHGLKCDFHAYTSSLGMGITTSLKRFSTEDWLDYERIGVRNVMLEFEREVKDLPDGGGG